MPIQQFHSLEFYKHAVSETRISSTRAFPLMYDEYQIFASVSWLRIGGLTLLFRTELDLEISSIFQDPDRKLIVLDMSHTEGSVFRLIAVYAPTGAKWSDYFGF